MPPPSFVSLYNQKPKGPSGLSKPNDYADRDDWKGGAPKKKTTGAAKKKTAGAAKKKKTAAAKKKK